MTDEIAGLCREYCGAVAVSWYRSSYTLSAIDTLLKAGVKTNIHYVISRSTLDEAIARLQHDSFPEGINAIVFLLHKPVGLGTMDEVVKPDDEKLKHFLSLAVSKDHPHKIGFDSCTVPAIISQKPDGIDYDSLDTCEGGRWSAYITADMKMLPCSFDNQAQRWAVDLKKHSIEDAWNSTQFDSFRRHFRVSCPGVQTVGPVWEDAPSVRKSCLARNAILNILLLTNKRYSTVYDGRQC